MTAAAKSREEGAGGTRPSRAPPGVTRAERLLEQATEIIDLDRLIKELQSKREVLWQGFTAAAGPEPAMGELVHVAVVREDAQTTEPSDVLMGKVRWFFQQVREPIDAETVAVALGVDEPSLPPLRAALARLAEAGELKKVGRGQYVKGRGPEGR